ncbi:MAG: hypothetical protein D6708_14500 [Candidatus Dadabacteria bacterium]|nr:MAG: hypothetical protein D6708_14500 [Candidatus Dadabacteria bacterium]
MQSVLRPMEAKELRLLALCVGVSLVVHALAVWLAAPGGARPPKETPAALAERFAAAVNAATDLDAADRAKLEASLTKVKRAGWRRLEMAETLQWVAQEVGVPLSDCDLVRALDAERAREGRWDIRAWVRWEAGADAEPFLRLAYLVGEGTLKSDFGSHRLWIHVEAPEGAGRVALETMDCRLFRAGKLSAADLLHRARWFDG